MLIDTQNICNRLWCRVGKACHSKLEPAADGTKCGDNKVHIELIFSDIEREASTKVG